MSMEITGGDMIPHTGMRAPVPGDTLVEVRLTGGRTVMGIAQRIDWPRVEAYCVLQRGPTSSHAPAIPPEMPFSSGKTADGDKPDLWTEHARRTLSPVPKGSMVDVRYHPTSDYGRAEHVNMPEHAVHWPDVREYRMSAEQPPPPWSPWTNDKPWALLTDAQKDAMMAASDHFAYLNVSGKWAVMSSRRSWGADATTTFRAVRILFGAP